MAYVTQEQFERFYNTFKDRPIIEMNEILSVIENQFGYPIATTKLESSKQMTDAIFSNEDILKQLRQSKADREAGIAPYSNDEHDFIKLVEQVNSDR